MIYSMTAYSRQQQQMSDAYWSWEIRTVNHRYLDISFRMPDAFKMLEPQLREMLGAQLERGKIECSLRWQQQPSAGGVIEQQAVMKLQNMLAELQRQLPQLAQPSLLDVLHWPGIVQESSMDVEQMHAALLIDFQQALKQLVESRMREGQVLANIIEQRLQAAEEQVRLVRAAQVEIQAQLRKKIETRLQPILENIDADNGRLEQELALQLQRLDVAEELDRLDAHVAEVRRILHQGGSCGRRLDFMMQELNREANTLSSKAAATSVVQAGVELKVLIEQMREQVQNIE